MKCKKCDGLLNIVSMDACFCESPQGLVENGLYWYASEAALDSQYGHIASESDGRLLPPIPEGWELIPPEPFVFSTPSVFRLLEPYGINWFDSLDTIPIGNDYLGLHPAIRKKE